ncbi:PRC-barrel domain-containing protein [Aurantimonas sp. A2-1-M11]|uniref:PRC-barrel domain-containing protein n=1 Tax=Aurantimonas sp. A2-1-M11 TaxID=3113712 RepID=UPI002F93DA51
MRPPQIILSLALLGMFGGTAATAEECNLADAGLEEAIMQKPELRGASGRSMVRDLRHLRDSAFILWSYGRYDDCARIMGNIRELVSEPSMASMGRNDEDEADQQFAAREPMVQRGAVAGHRDDEGAKPLVAIAELSPGLRANEFIGSEVRSSDDKIIGEVRNVVFETKDHDGYAVIASGGFFIPGTDSIIAPIRFLRVSQERDVFFLPMPETEVKTIPLMPDQDYTWLSDTEWRSRNDALFEMP